MYSNFVLFPSVMLLRTPQHAYLRRVVEERTCIFCCLSFDHLDCSRCAVWMTSPERMITAIHLLLARNEVCSRRARAASVSLDKVQSPKSSLSFSRAHDRKQRLRDLPAQVDSRSCTVPTHASGGPQCYAVGAVVVVSIAMPTESHPDTNS